MNKISFSKVRELLLGVLIISIIPGFISKWLFDSFRSGFTACFIFMGILAFYGTLFVKDEDEEKKEIKNTQKPSNVKTNINIKDSKIEPISKSEKPRIVTQSTDNLNASQNYSYYNVDNNNQTYNQVNVNNITDNYNEQEDENDDDDYIFEENKYTSQEEIEYNSNHYRLENLRQDYEDAMRNYKYCLNKAANAYSEASSYQRDGEYYMDIYYNSHDCADEIAARSNYDKADIWRDDARSLENEAQCYKDRAESIMDEIRYLS